MERIVLFENSDTQRVSVELKDTGDVLITKDWRKTTDGEWLMGKGLNIPKEHVENLGELLMCKDPEKLENLLSKYQFSKEISHHDKKNSHNRDN